MHENKDEVVETKAPDEGAKVDGELVKTEDLTDDQYFSKIKREKERLGFKRPIRL